MAVTALREPLRLGEIQRERAMSTIASYRTVRILRMETFALYAVVPAALFIGSLVIRDEVLRLMFTVLGAGIIAWGTVLARRVSKLIDRGQRAEERERFRTFLDEVARGRSDGE